MTRKNWPSRESRSNLNPRQQCFVREFAICGSAKRAAVLAGYSGRSAKQIGFTLLQNPVVRHALDALRSASSAPASRPSPEWALQGLIEETADPNPRVRLDAKKAVAQAVGVFTRREDASQKDCPRCRARTALESLSDEDLQLRVLGIDPARLQGMNAEEYAAWTESARKGTEDLLRLAGSYRLAYSGENG